MANASPWRKWGWNFVRVTVSLGLLTWVVSQITWQDRVIVDDQGKTVWGWLSTNTDGVRQLSTQDGSTLVVEPEFRVVEGFFTLLKTVDLRIFTLVVLLFPLVVVLTAQRWRWLLRTHDLDPGFWEALRLTWIGIFSNNALPGSSGGDAIKGVCIYRRTPGKRLAAVMTVLLDRVLGLVSMMLVGGTAILLASSRPELTEPGRYIPMVLGVVLVSGIVFFSGRIRRLLRVEEIVARLPNKGGVKDKIKKLDDSVYHFRNHWHALLKCVAISIPVHLWAFTCVWGLSRALGMEISPIFFFTFLPVIFTFGAVVPAPGGLGVLEGGFQYFFSLPGVGATPSAAVALCVMYRIVVILTSVPGAWPLYREMSSLRKASQLDSEVSEPVEPGAPQTDPQATVSP